MNVQATAHDRATDAALRIYGRVLEEVRGDGLVQSALQRSGDELYVQGHRLDLSCFSRILVCGAGKASASMAAGLIETVGVIDDGLIVSKRGYADPAPAGVRQSEAGHPVPDESSLQAGEQMLRLAGTVDERTLVFFLLSGGASSLMEAPVEGVTLEDLQVTNQFLLGSGQPIQTVNAVRSRLSLIKAGGLARAFAPATVVVLVLSDVLGNSLATIGSGPFVTQRPSGDASLRFAHSDGLPEAVRQALQEPRGIELRRQAVVSHHVVGSVSLAIQAALRASEDLGIEPMGYADPLQGEAKEMARRICRHGASLREQRRTEPFCLVFGGETTVTLGSHAGKGGRCQEMALAAAAPIAKLSDCAFLAAGTDGTDGPTDAAGATADPATHERATAVGMDAARALTTHQSYNYLDATDNLIRTGPTGSNVNDIALFVSLP